MESLVQSAHKQLEYTPMPIAATYAGLHEFSKLKLFNNVTIGNGVATVGVPPASRTTTMDAAKAVRYRECNRNHAINSGGHAVDGCGEFMPSGESGTVDALRCAACDCHRNFHRKEVEGEPSCDCKVLPAAAAAPAAIRRDINYAPARVMARGAGGSQQLALPSPAQIISRVTQSAPYQLLGLPHPASGPAGDSDDGDQGLSGSPSTIKKRFRTKFTTEQKERMGAFAEKLGWKIQKHDEAAVQEFCAEVGVKRHVLKVWMHNNKHTIGKKVP